MHPLKQLKGLLKETSPGNGKIVQVGNELRVATTRGTLSIQPSAGDATRYRVGDSVILNNGVVVGRRLNAPTVYVL
jgi:uncharacterized cupin superfamily protein